MTNQSLFQVVTKATRTHTRKSVEVDPAEVARVAQFHSFIQSHGMALFKTRDGSETFNRDTARAIAARVKLTARKNSIPLDCKAEPTGRDDDGNVTYGVRGWIPKARLAKASAVTL